MRSEVEVREGFAGFREVARDFLMRGTPPTEVSFFDQDANGGVADLFAMSLEPVQAPGPIKQEKLTVPPAYFKLAQTLACHASPGKWNLLYRILWRIQHENRRLLDIAIDDDIREAMLMEKAVKREIHKVHAFVRFEKIRRLGSEDRQLRCMDRD